MGTALTGQKVQDSYKDLLQVPNSNSGVDATLRAVEDGEGTATKLSLSTAQVCISDTVGNHAAAPSLAFGDANTGFYEAEDNSLDVSIAGTRRYTFTANNFTSTTAAGFKVARFAASATAPAYTFLSDEDTGVGKAAADQLSLIAGGVEGIRIHEATSAWVVQTTPATAAADATLIAGSSSFYLDESGHNLMVKVKYANGSTIKSGTVCAVA